MSKDLKIRILEAAREADRRYASADEIIRITATKEELDGVIEGTVNIGIPKSNDPNATFVKIFGRIFLVVTGGTATDPIADRDTRYSDETPPVDELEPILTTLDTLGEFTPDSVQWQDIMTTAADIEPERVAPKRYTLVQDCDSHWYIIPADKKDEFYKWLNTEEAELGIAPDWANHFGSGPEKVTFESPEIFGKKL